MYNYSMYLYLYIVGTVRLMKSLPKIFTNGKNLPQNYK